MQLYSVISQRQILDGDETGRYVEVVEVSFRTASGAVGSVKVPVSNYRADIVREAIEARVVELETVAGLGTIEG